MKLKHLKPLRVATSLIIFVFLLILFLGISTPLTDDVSGFFLRLQFFPSLIRFMALFFSITALGFIFVLLLTFLFGRVYCSSICPLGTLQDIFINGTRRLRKKKKRRFVYSSNSIFVLVTNVLFEQM
ncbi:MAG: 4Fe-4S binding protein [Bacteroidales bacterium]